MFPFLRRVGEEFAMNVRRAIVLGFVSVVGGLLALSYRQMRVERYPPDVGFRLITWGSKTCLDGGIGISSDGRISGLPSVVDTPGECPGGAPRLLGGRAQCHLQAVYFATLLAEQKAQVLHTTDPGYRWIVDRRWGSSCFTLLPESGDATSVQGCDGFAVEARPDGVYHSGRQIVSVGLADGCWFDRHSLEDVLGD